MSFVLCPYPPVTDDNGGRKRARVPLGRVATDTRANGVGALRRARADGAAIARLVDRIELRFPCSADMAVDLPRKG